MDLQTIRNRIIGRGIASSLEQYINNWINEAYDEIWNAYDWDFKLASASLDYTAGTATYAISSIANDIDKIYLIQDQANNCRLERSSLFKIIEVDPNLNASSTYPKAYYIVGSDLKLWPTPSADGTLTIYYLKSKADLALDTDIPLIPAHWHIVLLELAYTKALLYDDDPRAASAMAIYQKMLRDMKREQTLNVDDISKFGFVEPNTGLTV